MKHIVEQKLTERIVAGDLQARDESSSENLIFTNQLFVNCDQFALSVAKFDDEILKLIALDIAFRIWVKIFPHLQKFVNV